MILEEYNVEGRKRIKTISRSKRRKTKVRKK